MVHLGSLLDLVMIVLIPRKIFFSQIKAPAFILIAFLNYFHTFSQQFLFDFWLPTDLFVFQWNDSIPERDP